MNNTEKLRDLMAYHGLKAKDVSKLIHRSTTTVWFYMSEHERTISDRLLKVLETKLKQREEAQKELAG